MIVVSDGQKALAFFVVLFFAMLLALSASPAFAGAPVINSQKICKTREVDAKMFKSTTGQSVKDCVHDEQAAKQQLESIWASTPARSRNECESEAHALGTTSYLDLLTCIQMDQEMKTDPQKAVPQRNTEK